MKSFNAIVDAGKRWELLYEEKMIAKLDADGEPVLDGDGRRVVTSRIEDLRYRADGDEEWLELPPWAEITDDWMTFLCFFDEDEETGALTFWEVGACPTT